jgi:glycosyltransferase involved in cell wall biosynthesis
VGEADFAAGGLTGKRVAMLVWNGFIHDARVAREAESLITDGAWVHVTAVCSPSTLPAEEVTAGGIHVHRVLRENPLLSRLLFLPRFVGRRLRRMAGGPRELNAPFGDLRWWQLDRRLVFLAEELAVNWRMYRSARGLSPDIVHAHDVNTLLPAWAAARRSGARLIYDAHEISANREGYHGRVWLVKLAERWLGKTAAGRITTTQARADWFEAAYGYSRVVVLQNRPARCVADGGDRIRSRLGIPAGRPIVLYQGGLQPGRGLRNLLEAMRGLPQAELVLIGDGAQRPSLEAAAGDIAERVHFVGQVPLAELPAWTASADIGVQTLRNTCLNHYTTDSNKLFEYVMAGLPVVASDFPEIRAIVAEWDLGELVDPEDTNALHRALQRLVDDGDLRWRLAANARRARDSLDWASQAPKLLELYRTIVG